MKHFFKSMVCIAFTLMVFIGCKKDEEVTSGEEIKKEEPTEQTAFTLSHSEIALAINTTAEVTIVSGGGQYEIRSSDEAKVTATIANTTISIVAKAEGKATITVKDIKHKEEKTIAVTISTTTPNLAIAQTEATLNVGATHTISITAGSGNYQVVSDNVATATAEKQGDTIFITAKGQGVATITITDNETQQTQRITITILPSALPSGQVIEDGVLKRWDCSTVGKVVLPNTITSIGNEAFKDCKGITEIEIPDTVKSIGDNAFQNTTNLQSVTIKGTLYFGTNIFQDSGITSIYVPEPYVFSYQIRAGLSKYKDIIKPTLTTKIITLTVNVGAKQTGVVITSASNPCSDTKYQVVSGNPSIVKGEVSCNELEIYGIGQGTTTLTLTDTHLNKSETFSITVIPVAITDGTLSPNDLVFVEGGTFLMGSPDGSGEERERPQHRVTLSSFKISKYEITNAQYAKFLNASKNNHPYYDSKMKIVKSDGIFRAYPGFENHPVVEVNWHSAGAYAKWVGGRLPTEAEWEYAARGGNKSKGYKYSGSNNINEVAWLYDIYPVGTKKPNELGIYDMTGNVMEWCDDWYDSYTATDKVNPNVTQEPSGDKHRVIRGIDWLPESYHRVVARNSQNPDFGYFWRGFRVVFPQK